MYSYALGFVCARIRVPAPEKQWRFIQKPENRLSTGSQASVYTCVK